MKRYFPILVAIILITLLGVTCRRNSQEDNQTLKSNCIADKLEIIFFASRSSEMSFKARTITDKKQIEEICSFETRAEEKYHKTLPDGYLSYFKDSINIANVYFALDSTKGYFQYSETHKQRLISEKGYIFLKTIYDSKDWWDELEVKDLKE